MNARSRAVPLLLLLACSTAQPILPISPSFSAREPPDGGAGLHAGVAEGDITPTPGLALFGHGPEGRVAVGMRTRLRCQAFVLSSEDVVALITCDLAAADLELQRKIAQRLLEKGIPIGADRLYLMATHTHAGPAHYFTSRRYAGSFSSYRPGYDPGVVDFLVARISSIVERAYRQLAPACAGWDVRKAYGLTRNRSYTPFAANSKNDGLLATIAAFERKVENANRSPSSGTARAPAAAPPPSDRTIALGAEPRSHTEAAVDPHLWVLRVDARDGDDAEGCASVRPLGALAIFGMHPTGISNVNELYHGDIFGFATREIEACLRAAAHPTEAGRPASCNGVVPGGDAANFVAGIANGIEGDVSPAVDFQAPREAARLGRDLAHRILAVYDDIPLQLGLASQVPIAHTYRELRFPGAEIAPGSNQSLCESPALGTAAAGGAEDGPTRFRIVPAFNEGRRRATADGCHGPKLELIPPEGKAKSDGLQFPAVAPIALVRVGSLRLATVPAELTTVTGTRLSSAIVRRLGGARLAVVGLTNAYLQYVTTREEYAYQHYEGASTLYGPGTATFLASQFECLADWHQTGRFGDAAYCAEQPAAINRLLEIRQSPEPLVHRLEDDEPSADAQAITVTNSRPTADDGLPGWQVRVGGIPSSALAHRDRFSVAVVAADGRVVDDDSGANMEFRYEDPAWTVRWLPYITGSDPRCQQRYRIVIHAEREVSSDPFQLVCHDGPVSP